MRTQTPDQENINILRAVDDPGTSNEAFTGLYEAHSGTMHNLARRITGSHDTAEDIVQEAFLRLWAKRASIDDRKPSIRPWLGAVTRNLSIDHLAARERGLNLVQPPASVLPEQELANRGTSLTASNEASPVEHAAFHEMMEVLGEIDEPHKSTLELDASGVKPQELSEIKDIPENTAKSHAFRARKAAATAIKKKLGIKDIDAHLA